MRTKRKLICQMGPGKDMPGGMLSVIEGYLESPYLKEFAQIHIATASDKNKWKCFFKGVARYTRLITRREIRLAHLHMSERGSCYRAIVMVFISSFFGIPVVLHSHGGELEPWFASISEFRRNIFRMAMQRCQAVIVLTPGWIEFWGRIVEKDKLYVIPNCASTGEYQHREYLNSEKLNIVFLGYIGDIKGTFDLIRAVKILKDRKIDFCLRIGGNGEIEKCNALIEELGLQNDIMVYGWVAGDKKEEILNLSDVLVLPSMYESFGIVLVEAMAHQLPVICGSNGYSKEVVTEGVDGYVAESGNVNSIAEKLIMLNDQAVLRQFGNAAYKKAREEYSEECVMHKLYNLYRKL